MHLPDGILDPTTCVCTGIVSAATVGYAVHRVRTELQSGAIPLIGMTASCVFAAQMVNFPIVGGTSGHLLGGVLAAALLGPWVGLITMSIVLLVQSLLFHDGGVTALGANILNMGIIGSLLGYSLYSAVQRRIGGRMGIIAGAALASWFAVQIGAILCSIELAGSGMFRLESTLTNMEYFHSIIGVGEMLITGLAVACISQVRPSLLDRPADTLMATKGIDGLVIAGAAIALFTSVGLSTVASTNPDGLEATIERLGFDMSSLSAVWSAPFADYQVPGLQSLAISTPAAGMIGIIAVTILSLSVMWLTMSRGNRYVKRL